MGGDAIEAYDDIVDDTGDVRKNRPVYDVARFKGLLHFTDRNVSRLPKFYKKQKPVVSTPHIQSDS